MKAYVVDSAAVRSNLQQLQTRAGSAVLWAVLKGDAYGQGLLPMAANCRDAGHSHSLFTIHYSLFTVHYTRHKEPPMSSRFIQHPDCEYNPSHPAAAAPHSPVPGTGSTCRVLGHIGMLHTCVDVTNVPCAVGDPAVFDLKPLLLKGIEVVHGVGGTIAAKNPAVAPRPAPPHAPRPPPPAPRPSPLALSAPSCGAVSGREVS